MFESDEHAITINTVSRYFNKANPPVGVWSAGLIWNDVEVGPTFEEFRGELAKTDAKSWQMDGAVLAVLAGLERAVELNQDATVLSVNQSIVDTIPKYYDVWRDRGWKTASGEKPSRLEEWHKIKAITEKISVKWDKRKREAVDTIKDYEEFRELIENRENEFWMHRAMERDPFG